jgi:hypothetical protein
MKTFLLAAAVVTAAATVQAQDAATSRESPDTSIPYETGDKDKVAYEERWSDFLPIWGRAAREKGYVLPRPFGVSLGYMGQKQPFDVNGLEVAGVDVKTPGLAVVDEVDNQEDTITLRFDAWIFPFLNIYGILGKTDGQADGPLTVNPEVLFGEVGCAVLGIDCNPINTTFDIEYTGNVGGGGITMAGGYKDFFAMIDSNYTVTDLDISTTDANAWVTSMRFGWNGKLGFFTGALWIGAMHQDISQTLDLEIATGGAQPLDVSVEQATQVPWNTVLGGRWELGKGFEVLAEFGFGGRRSNMLNLTYRF